MERIEKYKNFLAEKQRELVERAKYLNNQEE